MMGPKQKLAAALANHPVTNRLLQLLRRLRPYLTRRNLLLGSGASLSILAVAYGSLFFWPRTVALSFDGDTCLLQPLILPQLSSKTSSQNFQATTRPSVSIGSYPLFSARTCIAPTTAPRENSSESISFGSAIIRKKIAVQVNELPKLTDQSFLQRPVSTQDSINMPLSSADSIFDYRLRAGDKQTLCIDDGPAIACDTTPMKLAQSKKYDFKLERTFRGEPAGTLFEQNLRTVQTIKISKSSIKNGQLVHSKPKNLVLTLNRDAVMAEDIRLTYLKGNQKKQIPTEASVSGKKATITFKEQLPREVTLQLHVGKIGAADGGLLNKPFTLKFQTSGGPKVTGANIGSYKSPTGGPYYISFDSPLLNDANAQKHIRLIVGGKVLGASISAGGNTATISPNTALPRCASFTIQISNDLQNKYKVSGGTGWSYSSRTICQSVFSIGASVQGRGITAYSFGTGGTKIVFVGGTHGDETSSVSLMNQWVEELEARGGPPAGKTVIVIPSLNPDGYAAGTRNNSRRVDLNRNFPANDWKANVSTPYGATLPKGGGSKPLSEPETAAIASYFQTTRPRLVLTYHAKAGVIIPNGSGDSGNLASIYDQNSNLYKSSGAGVFEYESTGEMEDWLRDKLGIPCLLIELWTLNDYEFSGNQNAMWRMIQ